MLICDKGVSIIMKSKVIIILAAVILIGFYVNNTSHKSNHSSPIQQNYRGMNQNYGGVNQNPVVPVLPAISPRLDSGLNNTNTRQICPSCYGSGNCPICHGTGYYSNYGFTSACNACDGYRDEIDSEGRRPGNGVCSACHGAGFIN